MILSIALIVTLVAVGTQAQTCQFEVGATYFIDKCLGEEIKDEMANMLKTRDTNGFLAHLERQFTSFYTSSGCSDPKLEQDLVDFLDRQWSDLSSTSRSLALQLVRDVQGIVWTVAENPQMASCLLNVIRDQFLKYLDTCLPPQFPLPRGPGKCQSACLEAWPVPSPVSSYRMDKVREWIELYIKAYAGLDKCPAKDQVVDKMLDRKKDDLCKCTKQVFGGGYTTCEKEYKQVCPAVNACMDNLINGIGKGKKFLEQVFEPDNLKDEALKCVRLYASSGGVSVGEIAGKGLQLVQSFKRFSDSTPASQKKRYEDFVKSVLLAHFSDDFCNDCTF